MTQLVCTTSSANRLHPTLLRGSRFALFSAGHQHSIPAKYFIKFISPLRRALLSYLVRRT